MGARVIELYIYIYKNMLWRLKKVKNMPRTLNEICFYITLANQEHFKCLTVLITKIEIHVINLL